MTAKSGPTFRACTEESLNNRMHSETALSVHAYCNTHVMSSATPNISEPALSKRSLGQLREKAFMHLDCSLQSLMGRADDRRAALRVTTTADVSLHSCFTALMNYFQETSDPQ